jgi:hypothetical protein
MDKAIKTHKQYILDQIEVLRKSDDKKALRELSAYHQSRVQDFQHERLVHLLVTLFFGTLMLLGFLSVVVLSSVAELSLTAIDPYRILLVLATILSCLLLVIELGYVWHYYKLENGVQDLYKISETLRKKIES